MVSTQKFPLADQRPLTEVNRPRQPATSEADFDPKATRAVQFCCDAQQGFYKNVVGCSPWR
jgi:hypothetical protein